MVVGKIENNAKKTIGILSRSVSSLFAVAVALLLSPLVASAQSTPPAADANCTVIAFNRSAPLQSDYSFTIFNIPSATFLNGGGVPAGASFTPPFRVRATCSDGTVGETDMAFAEAGQDVIYTGPIFWRPATPVPLALGVSAAASKLSAGQTTQLTATGILENAATVDLSTRIKGTLYTSSNPEIASVGENGLVTVNSRFSTASSARVVLVAQNEGVAGSTVLAIGPRGRLTGRVTKADGITAASGVNVTVVRNQPLETVGTVTTDDSGNYTVDDVSAGAFTVSAIDSTTGDQARGAGVLQTDGESQTIGLRLNGQGSVTINVVNASNAPVSNADVTFSSLSGFRDTRTLRTTGTGQVVFDRAMAGDFTVSTRDLSSNLVAASLGALAAGGTVNLTLKLQPVGAIDGVVYDAAGTAAQSGVQVRLISLTKGIVSQAVTGSDGAFRFDSLPLIDGPYTIDALLGGRLRARVPGLALTSAGQELAQKVVFVPVGTVSGVVTRGNGNVADDATVTLQSLVGDRWSYTVKTDAQGRYSIAGVPIGAFSVTATRNGGEASSAGGNVVSDGQTVALNMQLAASGIVGTVFERDGVTPVSAGITVALKPGTSTTQTNAQGQYSFTVTQPNTYVVEAADQEGNRGRTQISLLVINPTSPATVNVAFLGRGTVQGTVRDSTGMVQPGLQIQLTSNSVFGGQATMLSDAQGHYRFDGVFVGAFTLYARNEQTQLAGYSQQVTRDGEVVVSDIVLAATGSVSGRVVRQDNVTPLPGVALELYVNNALVLRGVADALGNYAFPAVPLGEVRVVATDTTGDKGQTLTRLTALGDTRTANIRMVGLGSVRVRAVGPDSQAVPGALVQLSSLSQFGGLQSKLTDASGVVQFDGVFNGDYNLSGSRTVNNVTITGTTTGTLANSVPADAQLTLTQNLAGTGRIAGVVTSGLNALPRAGVTVQMISVGVTTSMVTGADGAFEFNNVTVAASTQLTALVDNKIRARELGLTVTTPGSTLTRNLALIGVGTVRGMVTNEQNQPVAGARITLTNPDSIYGGTYTVTSLSDGTYSVADVAAGTFTVRADSADYRLQGQESGQIHFDADVATVNIALVDSAVSMPRNLYDANGNLYDLRGDGSIAQGTNSVFTGNGVDARATRLEVLVAGVPVPFTNGDGSVGRLTQSGQLIEVDELNAASGLNITRRVYVPKTGYFARFVEVLENRSASPITAALRITTNMAPGIVGARVVDSSDGDAVVNVSDPVGRDRWVVLDDDRDGDPFEVNGSPSVAVVFDGVGAAQQVAQASATAIGSTALKFQWQWATVTIEPGASVAYMHFASQQLGRIPAREAASRLVQLPPEALEGLTAQERSIIRNFNVPADGSGNVAPLPAMTAGTISGTVYAGDGRTPMASTVVALKSKHPLYQRTFRVSPPASGQFSFDINNFTANHTLRAIPIDRFGLIASYAATGAVTDEAVTTFADGQSSAEQDLVFNTTGTLRGTVRRHSGALVTSGAVSLPYRMPDNREVTLSALIQPDGNYQFPGLSPADYIASARTSHPQGQPILGSMLSTAAVPAGGVTVGDIVMEVTGEARGVVLDATGQPAVNATVKLDADQYTYYRATTTDTGGVYRFTDVREGAHAVSVVGANGLSASGTVSVTGDTQAVLDLQVQGSGTITVQVNFERGVGVPNAYVYSNVLGGRYTNAVGQATFTAVVGAGHYFTAYHPDNSRLSTAGSATLSGNGENLTLNLVLPAAGEITGTVMRQDGVTLAGNVLVTLRRQNTSETRQVYTNSSGVFRFVGMPIAAYYLSAEDRVNFKFADASPVLTTDGQSVEANLVLADNRIPLPATLYDANNFSFDVQRNGSLNAGTFAFNSGAAVLEVNGEAFTGDSSAFLEAGRRQFAVRQAQPIAGLNVTRKIFVPVGGYFARYLEILENPGTSQITASVRLRNRYYRQIAATETSSGDTTLSATGDSRDTWFTVDDSVNDDPFLSYASMPSLAHVLGQDAAASLPASLALPSTSESEAVWPQITVPAGGRVALMHFDVQQINRDGARAAAQRLQQLPPEALQALSADEIAAIANFNVPANGIGTLEALPSLSGRLTARLFEGDGRTPVVSAVMQVRSQHPLFNRTWTIPGYGCSEPNAGASWFTSATGDFALNGAVRNTDSLPLPVGSPIEVSAASVGCLPWYVKGHPTTRIGSRTAIANFAADQSLASVEVLFDSVILNGTVSGPADYGVGGGQVSLSGSGVFVSTSIANSGAFVIPGVPMGNFSLSATIGHNQGTSLIGTRQVSVAAIGDNLVADLQLEPTGVVRGAVLTAAGTPAAGMSVSISGYANNRNVTRSTTTDSLGQYNLSAVPVGSYTMTAIDSRDKARVTMNLSVGDRQSVVQNVVLPGTGVVSLTVNYARNTPAANADVYLHSDAISSSDVYVGRTDGLGRLTVLVPVGAYTIRARHPSLSNAWGTFTGTVLLDNQAITAAIALPAVASVRVTVVDQDNANAAISGASVYLSTASQGLTYIGTTNTSGELLIANVMEGSFVVRADTPQGRSVSSSGAVSSSQDGQSLALTLSLSSRHDLLGTLSFGYERRLYSVPANQGDIVGLRVSGAEVGQVPAIYLVRAEVSDPQLSLSAAGYGYGPGNNFVQYNYYNDLQNISVPAAGHYTIALSPYYQGYLGGFRLQATVNGSPVDILPYQDGGSVSGRLLRADQQTPVANAVLQLTGSGQPETRLRATTDADGNYRFDGVPIGAFVVGVPLDDGLSLTTLGTGTVDAVGQEIALDVSLLPVTQVNVQVRFADGAPAPWGRVLFNNQTVWANAAGLASYTYVGRDSLVVTAYHPSYDFPSASETIAPADGQTVQLQLTVATGSISGRVLSSTGEPMPWVSIRLQRASNGQDVFYANADEFGHYQFPAAPALLPISVTVNHPSTGVPSTRNVTLAADQALTGFDLQLSGQAQISGRVLIGNGLPVSHAEVSAAWNVNPLNADDIRRTTNYTGSDGSYVLRDVPPGVPVQVVAAFEGMTRVVTPMQTVTMLDAEDRHVDFTFDDIPYARLRVAASDGQPVSDTCHFSVYFVGQEWGGEMGQPPASAEAACSGVAVFPGVPAGEFVARVMGPSGWTKTSEFVFSGSADSPFTLNVETIRGRVNYADGAGVLTPGVSWTVQSSGDVWYQHASDADGNFVVYVPTPGTGILEGRDWDSGLYGDRSALLAAGVPLGLDVSLPPSGTVTGVLRDRGGVGVPNAQIYVRSSGLDLDRGVYTDENGAYVAPRMAAGDLTVIGRLPSGLVVSGTGVLAANGTTNVDLSETQLGVVSGRVTFVGSGSPLVGGTVLLRSTTAYGPLGRVEVQTQTDDQGNYRFDAAPVGEVVVSTIGGNVISTPAPATVTAGVETTANITAEQGVSLPVVLSGTDTSRYDVNCMGSLDDGGFGGRSDAYDGAYYLRVNGSSFPCQYVAVLRSSGREVAMSPQIMMDGLQVARRIYVPPEGGYARYIELFTNLSTNEIVVPVTIASNLGSDGSTRVIYSPASTGNRYAVTQDNGSDPALAHVFSGSNPPLAVSATQFSGNNDNVSYSWSLRVPAGGTASILHYAVQRAFDDGNGARTQAEALSTGTQPGMFTGLSSAERASVKNFVVPQ
jgi:hypothetical protein